jgi:hypothetical protein
MHRALPRAPSSISRTSIMPIRHWLTAAALAWLPFAANAEQAIRQPNPGDADAAVPALTHVSAFREYRHPADEEQTPDKVWREANEEMRRLGGHAGHAGAASSQESAGHHGHGGGGR